MKYNAVLKRKGFFNPLCTVLEIEIPDDTSKDDRERIIAEELLIESGLYIDVEKIKPEKPHKLEKTEL